MNRRELLKLIALGIVGHELDIDRLLWIPGQKTIFIPPETKSLTLSQIVDLEMKRMLPYVKQMFERDDMFYRAISRRPK
jgi:hypothetical protein